MAQACVTQKKYDAMVANRDRLVNDSTALEQRIDGLESDLDSCNEQYVFKENQLNREIDNLQAVLDLKALELDEKNQVLKARAEKLRELQELVDRQRAAVENLRKKVASALIAFSDADQLSVEVDKGRVKVSLSEDLLFESGKVDLDEKGKDALGKLAVVLKNNPDINIQIVGFTDTVPIRTARFKDNWDLSVIRATSIARILTEEYGVSPKRLIAAGQGQYNAVATNETKEGRSLNRRTEIFLIPNLDELFGIIEETGEPAPKAN